VVNVQSVKWVCFGISNALTRTIVHFFPSEGGVTAPFPATFALRIFGQGVVEKKVLIEGARLSHPDGVRVEDAFPALKSEQVGMVGLEIEVTAPQGRADLSSSACVIELASKGHSAKFLPKRLIAVPTASQLLLQPKKHEDTPAPSLLVPPAALALRDSFSTSSIVVVNGTAESYRPALCAVTGAGEAQDVSLSSLPPGAAGETALDDGFFSDAQSKECSWGISRAKALVIRESSFVDPKATFLVYRDALTRRPVSVRAL
jgi:hypothetical protein